jgi:hypothetical protein
MPTQHVQSIVKHHKRALYTGAAVGLTLISAFVVYELAATPAMPVVPRASASEIVAYIGNQRGLAGLPDVQQKQFLDDWKRRLNDTAARDDLKQCLKDLDDEKRKDFFNGLARHLKKAFLDDAKLYSRLKTPAEKDQFCRQKLIEGRDQALQFKDIALALKTPGTQRPDDIQQWVMENTTAEERVIGEPFVDALKRVREQVKKEERAPTTSAEKKP